MPTNRYIAVGTASIELDGVDAVVVAGRTCVIEGSPLLKIAPSLFKLDLTGTHPLVAARYSRPCVPADPNFPHVPDLIPQARRRRATRYVVHNGVQVASPGQVFDADSGLAHALEAEYPGLLVADDIA